MTQMSIPQAMQLAFEQHRAGNLQQAESICRQVLAVQPNNYDALQELGVIAFQAGALEQAKQLLVKASQIDPKAPDCLYNLALVLNASGNPLGAIDAYRKAIVIKPDFFEAYNNLGATLLHQNDIDGSIEACRKAVALRPHDVPGYENLGLALRRKGKIDEAMAAHRRSIELDPKSADAWNNLGIVLQDAGRLEDALAAHQKSLSLNPNQIDAIENAGLVLQKLKRNDEALALLRKAIAARPDSPDSLSNLGAVLCDLEQFAEAMTHIEKAIRLRPDFAEAHNNLGLIHRAQKAYPAARTAHERAIAIRPDFMEAWSNLGQTLQLQGLTHEAMDAYRRAVKLRPGFSDVYSSMGTAQVELQQLDDAIGSFREAIRLRPNYALAHFNLSQALLMTGQWREGWEEQEWRWKARELKLPKTSFTQPEWTGEPLNGRRIFIYCEQGFGDSIMFARFLPLVAKRGGRIVLGCQREVQKLLASVEGVEQTIVAGEDIPPVDLQCALMSLPRFFDTTPLTVPREIPYLHPDPQLVDLWRQRVSVADGKFKVGLVWAGRPDHKNDRNRSMPLKALLPLANAENVWFCSLQKGTATRQLREVESTWPIVDYSDQLADFSQTAALIENLDLIITPDTAAAHLAGAIGKPVWVITAFLVDWRNMLNRRDNPWYPSMCLFRQTRAGEWETPVLEVLEALRNR